MKRDYMIFYRNPKDSKQVLTTFFEGADCLTALENFTVYYKQAYETKDEPHVEAVRRTETIRPPRL